MIADKTLDLASIRARPTDGRGRRYWQSLEELADTEAFGDFVKREFPRTPPNGSTRSAAAGS